MSDLIGYTQCQMKGCKCAAEFKTDKRQKKFINCPTHGRIPGSTNEAQKELEALLVAGVVFDTSEDYYEFCENIDKRQPLAKEGESQNGSEDESEDKSEKSKKTKAIFLVSMFLGGVAWLINQSNQNIQ